MYASSPSRELLGFLGTGSSLRGAEMRIKVTELIAGASSPL